MATNDIKTKYLQILETIFSKKAKYAAIYESVVKQVEASEGYLLERVRRLVIFVNASEANKQHFLNMKIKLFYKDNKPPMIIDKVSCKKMLLDFPQLWEHLHYLYILYEAKNKERDHAFWQKLMHLIQLNHENLAETREILDNMMNDIYNVWAQTLQQADQHDIYTVKQVKRIILDTLLRTTNLINKKYKTYFVSGQFNTAIIRKQIIKYSPMIAKNMEFFDKFIQPLEFILEHVGKNGIDFKSYQDQIEEKLKEWMKNFDIKENDNIQDIFSKLTTFKNSKIGVGTIDSSIKEYMGRFKNIDNLDDYIGKFFDSAVVQQLLTQLKLNSDDLRQNITNLFNEIKAIDVDSLEKVPGVVDEFLEKYSLKGNIIGETIRKGVRTIVANIMNDGEVDLSKMETKLKEIGMTKEEFMDMLKDENMDIADIKLKMNNWLNGFIDEDADDHEYFEEE